jgi:rhomboid protease GluP
MSAHPSDPPSTAAAAAPPSPAGASSADAELAEFHARLAARTPRLLVTPALVALNVLAFLAAAALGVGLVAPTGESLIPLGANYGPRTLAGEPWRLLTSAFLHFGVLHLAMNLFALATTGPLVERLLGSRRFGVLYVTAGVLGSLASVCVHPEVVSAGASGSVFGVYGALAAFLTRHRSAIPARALKSLSGGAIGFIAYNLAFGFAKTGIDNAAHLGGLVAGALCGLLLGRPLGRAEPDLAPTRGAPPEAIPALAVLLAIAVTTLLPAPPDLLAITTAFSQKEALAIERFNALVKRAKERKIPDAAYAGELEAVVLPTWRQARAVLEAPVTWPAAQRPIVEKLRNYAEARERGWTSLVTALRTQDAGAAAAAAESQQEAERILKSLGEK